MAEHDAPATTQSGRLRPWIGEPPLPDPPVLPGQTLVAHERFEMVRGTIAGLVLLPFWWVAFSLTIAALGGRFVSEYVVTPGSLALSVVVLLLVVPVLHEAAHGLAALAAGERPSFGVGPGFAYTTFRRPVGKTVYLLVALAPLAALTTAGVALALVWEAATTVILVALATNAAGAVGDLWMSWRAVGFPSNASFVDLADGFAVYLPTAGETPVEG